MIALTRKLRLKQAKQEALRLISQLPSPVRGHVQFAFNSTRWAPLIAANPEIHNPANPPVSAKPQTPSATDLPRSSEESPVQVRKASIASVSNQPKATTEQALKGYAHLKSRTTRHGADKAATSPPSQALSESSPSPEIAPCPSVPSPSAKSMNSVTPHNSCAEKQSGGS